jgi:hypothetical protein
MAFRVQGTVHSQSLGGAGYDNREAPIAVMIRYTTRMFWWGFGYLDPTNNFGFSFTPNITAVEQGVKFDKTIDLLKALTPKPKLIHSITIEGSGWALDSVVHQFAMKPLEAFADPEAPYRTDPTMKPTANQPDVMVPAYCPAAPPTCTSPTSCVIPVGWPVPPPECIPPGYPKYPGAK